MTNNKFETGVAHVMRSVAIVMAIITVAVIASNIRFPHHTVKASGGIICIGACSESFTPPSTCVDGGIAVPPETNHLVFTIGQQAYFPVGAVPNCQATINYLDVSLAGNVSTGSAVLVSMTTYSGGVCPTSMTGTAEIWSHALAVSSNTKSDHYVTPIGGLIHAGQPNQPICIWFSSAVPNAYETMNIINSYQ